MRITLDQALEAAASSCKTGDFDTAVQYYHAIIKKLPYHPEANHNLAQIYSHDRPEIEVAEFFNRAIEAKPDSILFWESFIRYLLRIESFPRAKHVLEDFKKQKFPKGKVNNLESHFKSKKSDFFHTTVATIREKIENKDLQTALTLTQKLDKIFPENKIILNLLGIIYTNKMDYPTASVFFQQAIEKDNRYTPAITNYGNLLRDQKKYKKSEKQYLIAEGIDPKNYENKVSFGKLRLYQKKFNSAKQLFKEATDLKPHKSMAYFYLGTVLMETEQHVAAIKELKKAISLDAKDGHALNNLALCYEKTGKLTQAIETLKVSLSLESCSVLPKQKLAKLYDKLGDKKSAFSLYSSILEADKNNIDALLGLGRLSLQSDANIAVDYLTQALSFRPDDISILNLLAQANIERFKFDIAEKYFQKALLIDEDHIETLINTIYFYQYNSELNEAVHLIERVLDLEPNNIPANILALKMGSKELVEKAQQKLLKLSRSKNNSVSQKYSIYFGLAEQFDKLENYKEAFKYYTKGNQLKSEEIKYSFEDEVTEFKNIKSRFKELGNVYVNSSFEKNSFTPLFIVGMPRSGTSLVEQIISAHSDVFGAGELTLFSRFNRQLNPTKLSGEIIKAFREKYTKRILSLRHSENFVTDKMPANFKHIGLIMKVFPEAKIIHIKRNAYATCWSNYTQLFASGQGYSYQLCNIHRYFQIYVDYMKFWDCHFGDHIYTLQYETLVQNFKNEVKKLIHFCGLPWEKGCLEPHNNARAVKTASKLQVRQKVYVGSSQRWESYKPFIGDAFNGL